MAIVTNSLPLDLAWIPTVDFLDVVISLLVEFLKLSFLDHLSSKKEIDSRYKQCGSKKEKNRVLLYLCELVLFLLFLHTTSIHKSLGISTTRIVSKEEEAN